MDKKTASVIAKNLESTAEQLELVFGIDPSVDRLLAKHTKVDSVLLEKLSHSSDKVTRKNVVVNPSASKDTLLKLAPQFPGDFFKNPAFDWLLLEDPYLLFNLGQGVLKNILKRPECPESFMKWAVEHGSEHEKLAVAMNRNASKEDLQKLVAQGGKVRSVAEYHTKLQPKTKNIDLNQVFTNKFKELLHELQTSEAFELFGRNLIDLPQFIYLSAAAKVGICGFDYDLLARTNVKLDAEEIYQILYACANYDANYCEYPEALPLALPSLVARPEFKKGLEKFMAFVTAQDPLPEMPMDKQLLRLAIPLLSIEPSVSPVSERLFNKLDHLVEYTWAPDSAPAFLHPDCPQRLKDKYAKEIEELQVQREERKSDGAIIKVNKKLADLITFLNEKIRKPYQAIVKNWRKNPDIEHILVDDQGLDSFISECLTFQCAAEEFIRDDYIYFGAPKVLLDRLYKAIYSICEMMTEEDEIFIEDYPSDYFLSVLSMLASTPCRSDWLFSHASNLKGAKFRQVVKAANKGSSKDAISTIVESPTETFWFKARLKRSYDKNVVVAVESGDIFFIRDSRAVTACNNKSLVARILGLSRKEAYPDVLAKRSKSIEWIERMTVARNLNTPLNIIELMKNDPHQIVAMQARATCIQKQMDLVRQKTLLEKPLQKIDFSPLLLGCGFYPSEPAYEKRELYFDSLSLNDLADQVDDVQIYLKCGIASSSKASAESLMKLAKDQDTYVRQAVARNPHSPKDAFALLAQDNEPEVRQVLASNPKTPISVLETLSKNGCFLTKLYVLNNPSISLSLRSFLINELQGSPEWMKITFRTLEYKKLSIPPELLEKLAQDSEKRIRDLAAINPSTPAKTLETLALDDDKYVRSSVASNSSTPAKTLEMLALDDDKTVREVVANNPAIPSKALELLVTERFSYRTMDKILNNPILPASMCLGRLDELAKDKIWYNQSIAARCPRTPLHILEELSKDRTYSVRAAVAENVACPSALLEEMYLNSTLFQREYVSQAVAGNRNTQVEVLQKLSLHKDKYTRMAVAQNPSATTEILDRLFKDKDKRIRLAVAKNKQTPLNILDKLSQDLNGEVRQAVRVALKDRGVSRNNHPVSESTGFVIDDFIIPFETTFTDLSNKGLANLANSKDWLERSAAAIFPETQPYLLFKLLEDEVKIVRQIAAKRLKEIDIS